MADAGYDCVTAGITRQRVTPRDYYHGLASRDIVTPRQILTKDKWNA